MNGFVFENQQMPIKNLRLSNARTMIHRLCCLKGERSKKLPILPSKKTRGGGQNFPILKNIVYKWPLTLSFFPKIENNNIRCVDLNFPVMSNPASLGLDVLKGTAIALSMSFYPDFISILSWFYPVFILILSKFYPDKIRIKFG